MSLPDRFWDKVDRGPGRGPDGSCWTWTTSVDTDGYGQIRVDGRMRSAHRLAYESLVGAIPQGLELDHTCRVRACVNPAHLEPVTHAENVRRGRVGAWQRAKTHCPKGHPYDTGNTYLTRDGRRCCRRCAAIRSLARYHAMRGAPEVASP